MKLSSPHIPLPVLYVGAAGLACLLVIQAMWAVFGAQQHFDTGAAPLRTARIAAAQAARATEGSQLQRDPFTGSILQSEPDVVVSPDGSSVPVRTRKSSAPPVIVTGVIVDPVSGEYVALVKNKGNLVIVRSGRSVGGLKILRVTPDGVWALRNGKKKFYPAGIRNGKH